MVTVSSPPPRLSSSSLVETTDETGGMDGLLEKLKNSMVELILQGDDVTRQMWHMYSVFEEIFGRQSMTTSSNQPLKHVVVGDRLKGSSMGSTKCKTPERVTPTSPLPSSSVSTITTTSSPVTTTLTVTSSSVTLSSSSNAVITVKNTTSSSENAPITTSSPPKVQKSPPLPSSSATSSSSPSSSDISKNKSGHLQTENSAEIEKRDPLAMLGPPSNPLLDTIGELANTNADSDDSDLDIVYQQLRYQGRQRKPEQMRIRTHRTHRHNHQQVASSDPESIAYAGSNSIDSGYKSLCATPEVSDTLSAPEVRRSASDVSASDSSTTSGRPRSLDGQDSKSAKIKMGTRSIAGKFKIIDRSNRQPHTSSAMNDVTLDHLMYLRQSLRKDRGDVQRSPSESLPSSATASTFRDSDLSPRTMTDEEWRDRPHPFHRATSSSSESTFTGERSSRSSSRGGGDEEIDQEGGGESSSDFLLSGVEYYDLESIREFPPSINYVTMMEEKTRCARFKLVSASKCAEPLTERQLSSLYRKRSESTQSVDGDHSRTPQQHIYGVAGQHHPRTFRSAAKLVSRHHRQHHATDSKLTEAAIRVLEMIEDFRMEEAMTRSGRILPYQAAEEQRSSQLLMAGSSGATGNYPSTAVPHQSFLPRYRKAPGFRAGARPASTGSLLEQEIDTRSVASASSYAASAEHHVYEEIMYDLVCERAAAGMERGIPPPIPPERERIMRSRLLPVPPHTSSSRHPQVYASAVAMDPRRVMVRSHKHRSSNLYSLLSNAHGRNNVDRFLEMEWHLSQERRDNLPPDFPV